MKKQTKILSIVLVVILLVHPVYAQELIYLRNGDRLSGSIMQEVKDIIVFDTEFLGTVNINKKHVEKIESAKIPEEEALEEAEIIAEWTRVIEVGYNYTTGNTETSQFSSSVTINRKVEKKNETTLKGNIYQSSSNNRTDTQIWDSLARFAYSFGQTKKWYHYFKNELDHDKFANIDYREIPSSGIGYWFSDEDPLKFLSEVGGGYEYIEFNNDTENSESALITPRLYAEWNIIGDVRLSEELASYHSIDDYNEYRLISTTTFTNPITENLSFKIKLINKYENEPAEEARNNDLRLESSLAYKF